MAVLAVAIGSIVFAVDVEPFELFQGTGLPQCREAIHKIASLLFVTFFSP
jgi:hypothetical protein